MKTWEELVTPERASELLAIASRAEGWRNRKLSTASVDNYAAAMRRGEWKEDANIPIFVDEYGVVIDGQHRLAAIVKSCVTVRMTFISTKRDCFDVFDKGKKRTLADNLSSLDYKNAHTLSSVLTAVRYFMDCNIDGVVSSRGGIPLATAIDTIEKYPDIIRVSSLLNGKWKQSFHMPTSIHGLFFTVFGLIDAEKRDEFFDRLNDGVNLSEDSPIRALREWAKPITFYCNSEDRTKLCNATIYCWNRFYSGEKLKALRAANFTPKGTVRLLKINGFMDESHKCSVAYVPTNLRKK